jgi:hypothetical protein
VIQPPRVGPRVGPAIIPRPNSPIAIPTSSRGNASNSTACDVAMRAPPPNPWTTRQKISSCSVPDAPQKKDEAVKMRMDVTK